ncbi:winged helix-turn-helix transcriptional regulator [Nakamurella sp. YIM 132087]|uniref:Winged helix-turn-helix transcriptional regulator n=1 Tax=Nakamurella alba TaxID=2665158 RepID=A0A7K1FR18_9ACTN|nr:Lrp/AsnC family transcriptional regulator [Nakamurella alba]MTD16576.1 winged helix-turn-helix transcriptional regulator [Nakamurella alba]
MALSSSDPASGPRVRPQDVRPLPDEVDRRILRVLAEDARITNNALAERVGIAPSTCLGRVRALRESGVIRGYRADIDPEALGLPLQAMIAVRLQAGHRGRMAEFTRRIRERPEVLDVYFLAGADDFLLHVATADAGALRDFVVDALSAHPEVALTETNLIFEHVRGAALS